MRTSKAATGTRRTRDDDETFEVQQYSAMDRPNWNDGRLDDLNHKVDKGIGRLDDERNGLRSEMRAGFARVDGEFKAVRSEMRDGFARIDERFDQLTRFLLVAALAIVVALIGAPHI